MANEKNLLPLNKRPKSEQRRIQAMGGVANGELRRKRKALKDSMNALLELPISNARDFNAVAKMGIAPEELDNSQLIVLALFHKAKSGDVAAFKELRDLIGESAQRAPGQDTESSGLLQAIAEAMRK